MNLKDLVYNHGVKAWELNISVCMNKSSVHNYTAGNSFLDGCPRDVDVTKEYVTLILPTTGN